MDDLLDLDDDSSSKATTKDAYNVHDNNRMMIPFTVVMLCGLGPNQTRFIYGFGMFSSENSLDMTWMLKQFKSWGLELDTPETIVLSDRGAAVIKTYQDSFTQAIHLFCAAHLVRNLKARGRVKALSIAFVLLI